MKKGLLFGSLAIGAWVDGIAGVSFQLRVLPAVLLAMAGSLGHSHESASRDSLQTCDDAMRDYDVAVQGDDADASAQARQRMLNACYAGSGRTPMLQEPISIGADRKAAAPAKPAPAVPTLVMPSAPSVITACDPGGCWDNLGNRYNGSGAALIGPTGKLCIRIGDQIECR